MVTSLWDYQDGRRLALPGGTVTLRLHRNLLAGIWERRAMWMLTIEGLISVLGLCLTCFGLGYAMGNKDNNHTQK